MRGVNMVETKIQGIREGAVKMVKTKIQGFSEVCQHGGDKDSGH